jgi:uncharacterized protein YjbJ (UPF0337 family)
MKGDKNIVDGKMKQVEGKIRDAYGDLAGDPVQDAKGKAKQIEGKIQESYGRAQNAVQDRDEDDDDDDDKSLGV